MTLPHSIHNTVDTICRVTSFRVRPEYMVDLGWVDLVLFRVDIVSFIGYGRI